MAITHFIPELWEAAVQEPYEAELVFGQPKVSNTKYDGTISQQGDTVRVTTIGAPTIRKYDKNADITVDDLNDGEIVLEVDQADYFAFRVNDVDKVQAAGDFQSPATKQAGIGLRDTVDNYIAGLYQPSALEANKFGRAIVIDDVPQNATVGQISAYQLLVKLREKLDKQSVPTVGRYVVVPPEMVSALLMDKRYTDLSNSGSSEALLNGQVGRATGFEVLVSNNIATVGGAGSDKSDLVICAGVPDAVTTVNQLNNVEAMREQNRFADRIRGLNIYGGKVFRPEGIATATVRFAPATAPAAG